MHSVTVFYSWQSDCDSKLCRRFLEIAIEEAAKILQQESIELIVDSDTKGTSGTPPVSETILQKIREADVFLADMTLVAETPGGKRAPNPNVLVEYGYALHAKGHGRIILTMNTGFGEPNLLPFDLRHLRHPLQYQAPESIRDGDRRAARSAFAILLADAIRMVADRLRDQNAEPAAATTDRRQAAHELMTGRANAFFSGDVPTLVSRPRLVLHGVPYVALDRRVLAANRVGPVVEAFIPPGFARADSGSNSQYWWTCDPPQPVDGKPNPESRWAVTFARPGVLECAINLGERINGDKTILLEGKRIETWIVRIAEHMTQWADAVGLDGPMLVGAGLEGLEDVDILPGRGGLLRAARTFFHLTPQLVMPGTPVASALHPLLDEMWVAFGKGSGSPSFGGGEWAGYGGHGDYRI